MRLVHSRRMSVHPGVRRLGWWTRCRMREGVCGVRLAGGSLVCGGGASHGGAGVPHFFLEGARLQGLV